MSPTLGSAFGHAERKASIERQLVPGVVIYLQVTFSQIIKDKYLVLVGEDSPDCFTFIVNSETHRFIERNPHLNVCQVVIDAADHPFLAYDSKIACHDVLRLPKEAIIAELMMDMTRIKGQISNRVRDEITAAVKHARTLDPYTQRLVINALSS